MTGAHSIGALAMFLWAFSVLAAPPAGTTIKNQASATYQTLGGLARTATSNLVETVVTQVAGVALTTDQAKAANPGGTVGFPHLVTNTGNGPDSFTLAVGDVAATDDFDFEALLIYPDADRNGIADSVDPVSTTGLLAAGEAYHFVVLGVVPRTASAGDSGALTVTATSEFDAIQSVTNSDTARVTDDAVVEVTKWLSAAAGAPGSGPYTVTLRYTNLSAVAATDLTLVDALPPGMSYVAGSARWSVTGGTALTDADDADAQGSAPDLLTFCAYEPSCVDLPFGAAQVTALIARVAPGDSGTLSFSVNVDNVLVPQVLRNTASFSYHDGNATTTPVDTNTVPFEVTSVSGVGITGDMVDSASPGEAVPFQNRVVNEGTGPDTFNVVVDVAGSSFPAGTNFVLLAADGATPLLDTDSDGVPDTGPLAPGAGYTVVLQVTLPPDAPAGGGPYVVTKDAVSASDVSAIATATDTLTTVAAMTVDLTNGFAAGDPDCDAAAANCGFGAGPESEAQTTLSGAPGDTVSFSLYINNTSAVADSYDLQYSGSLAFPGALPDGWRLVFRDASGAPLTNTGELGPGESLAVTAEVAVPGRQAAGTQAIYFRAVSPTSGASDVKYDTVAVSEVHLLRLEEDQRGQVNAGGTLTYTHNLTNDGNVTEAAISLAVANDLADSGWSAVVYLDSDGDGVLSAADTAVDELASLAPGEQVVLHVKVLSPSDAGPGAANSTLLTATDNAAAAVAVTDVTTVNRSDVAIFKEQAIDADCSGTPDGGASAFAPTPAMAAPGQCIRYRLAASNSGTEPMYNVTASDATPAYTTFEGPAACTTAASCSIQQAPATGGIGAIRGTAAELAPGDSLVVTFGVRVD